MLPIDFKKVNFARGLSSKQFRKNIIAYMDGLPLKGLKVEQINKNTVEFILARTSESQDTWKALLYHRGKFATKNVSLSIGLEDESPVKSEVNSFQIDLVDYSKLVIFGTVGLFTIVLFFWLIKSSEILRNCGPAPDASKKRTFSLALSQMAAWFIIVIFAFMMIWMITGERDTITNSLLCLIGISAGTFVGAAVIDKSKLTEIQDKLSALTAEQKSLTDQFDDLKRQKEQTSPQPTTTDIIELTTKTATIQSRLSEIKKQLDNLPPSDKGPPSRGWFKDVLSDANGISLHRFQMLIWTIVLIFIFITDVYNYLSMPDFSSTLLGLMGISSGTYIGFKFPEQNQS
jgi:hypothetical protein